MSLGYTSGGFRFPFRTVKVLTSWGNVRWALRGPGLSSGLASYPPQNQKVAWPRAGSPFSRDWTVGFTRWQRELGVSPLTPPHRIHAGSQISASPTTSENMFPVPPLGRHPRPRARPRVLILHGEPRIIPTRISVGDRCRPAEGRR